VLYIGRWRFQPLTAHDLVEFFRQVPWILWALVALGLGMALRGPWKQWSRKRRAREAEDWPAVEGMVQSIFVGYLSNRIVGARGGSNASFTYSYSVRKGAEVEYFSGRHSRFFQNEGDAWDWLRTLKGKRIRVHVKPGKPAVSAVLLSDLDTLAGFAPASTPSAPLTPPGTTERIPEELRAPTEMAAWLLAFGFCLSFADHLCRVLAGKPLHPQLATVLWIGFAAGGIPFGLWYQSKGLGQIFGKPKAWARVPQWLRISTYALNLYAGSFWLINMVLSSGAFHASWDKHRLEPMSNGAFLALLYGDAAAILYARLENSEDPYNLSASGIHPE